MLSKRHQVVMFSCIAIALYGYDQGMMSLINSNENYLATMGIAEESPLVGVIVAVYYLGCALGAILASTFSDMKGRKPAIYLSLLVTIVGNLIMFFAGFKGSGNGLAVMLIGRIVLGLGVGAIDAVIPVFSAELVSDESRGKALGQEFQSNILGLNIAYAINLILTRRLGSQDQWAWRTPIISMQIFPLLLLGTFFTLPETPRYHLSKEHDEKAKKALIAIQGEKEADKAFDDLCTARDEEKENPIGYSDMLRVTGNQFHPTVITIMGQVNQALTGYGAVRKANVYSVFGAQIFQLLGFTHQIAQDLTAGNYISYFILMTFCWILIDRLGRRKLMLAGSLVLIVSFALLTLLAGLAMHASDLDIPKKPLAISGSVILYLATGAFGIGWLVPPWLIPTELYPSTARAKGSAISCIVWGISNFVVTLLTPIGFNNLKFWLFLVFALTNLFAGWFTYTYSPETGARSFEENQEFFEKASKKGSWRVHTVARGDFLSMPDTSQDSERRPLLTT